MASELSALGRFGGDGPELHGTRRQEPRTFNWLAPTFEAAAAFWILPKQLLMDEAFAARCVQTFGSGMPELANPAPKFADDRVFVSTDRAFSNLGFKNALSIRLNTLSADQTASPWEEGHWK